jgi:hypothetical protein
VSLKKFQTLHELLGQQPLSPCERGCPWRDRCETRPSACVAYLHYVQFGTVSHKVRVNVPMKALMKLEGATAESKGKVVNRHSYPMIVRGEALQRRMQAKLRALAPEVYKAVMP